jgi:hypothetical protein
MFLPVHSRVWETFIIRGFIRQPGTRFQFNFWISEFFMATLYFVQTVRNLLQCTVGVGKFLNVRFMCPGTRC